MKPNIESLAKFAGEYVRNVSVKWVGQTEDFWGLAKVKRKAIYLNTKIPLQCIRGFYPGDGCYSKYSSRKGLGLTEGKQYFLVLLHEIGHFRRHRRVPKYYKWIRDQVRRGYPRDKEMQVCSVEDYVKRRKGESDAKLEWRLSDIRCYVCGGGRAWIKEFSVDSWARREFKRKRNRIGRLLAQAGGKQARAGA